MAIATRASRTPRRSGQPTGLAAEFYVLSCLHRLGLSATLTLTNTKSVDLVIANGPGRVVTVQVKGVAGRHDWPASNLGTVPRMGHVVVLVCFNGKFDDPSVLPDVWIIPHPRAIGLMKAYSGRSNIRRKDVIETCHNCRGNWAALV